MRLCWGRESDISMARMTHTTNFWPLDHSKMLLGWNHTSNFSRACKALLANFLLLVQPKMRFGWSGKSDDSSCRIALSSNFLILDQPKKRCFSTRLSDDSSRRMALKSHFLPLDKPKRRLWSLPKESDVSSSRKALGTHFIPIDQPKIRLGWSRERGMFQGLPFHFELIFGLLTIAKCEFVEVENSMFKGSLDFFRPLDQLKMRLGSRKKATFLVVARQWELIFCVMNSPKCDFHEVEKAMIQVFEVIFCFLATPKFDFVEVEKAMVQVTPCTGNPYPSYWTRQNVTWGMSRRRCFKGSHVTSNSFSASCPSQNANLLRSKTRCSRAL